MSMSMTTDGVTVLLRCIDQLMGKLGEADRQLTSLEKASLEKRDILIRARDILWDGGASSLVSEQSLVELAAERMNQLYEAEARINKVLTLLKGITNPLAADVREALTASTDDQKEGNK